MAGPAERHTGGAGAGTGPAAGHFLDDLDPHEPFSLRAALGPVRRLFEQVLATRRDPASAADGPMAGGGLIGLDPLVARLIQALILGEHCLLEGYPGLAKTRAVRTLADMLGLTLQRIQFVPDLMPSDLIQRERLNLDDQGRASIDWVPGPIFTNLLLADEINRASPKAQAALLEVTEERRVTPLYRDRMVVRPRVPEDEAGLLAAHGPYFGEDRIDPDDTRGQVFLVLATMNPIEQEGVYPLSEAQLDRFAFKLLVDYPRHHHLDRIAAHAFEADAGAEPNGRDERGRLHVRTLYFLTRLRRLLLGPAALDRWMGGANDRLRGQVAGLIDFTHLRLPREGTADDAWTGVSTGFDDRPKNRELLALLRQHQHGAGDAASPQAQRRADHALWLEDRARSPEYPEVLSGSSPRGLLKLIRAAHAEAFWQGCFDPDDDNRVVPRWEDVRAVAVDVLRHRVRLTTSATAQGMTSEQVIGELLSWIERQPT